MKVQVMKRKRNVNETNDERKQENQKNLKRNLFYQNNNESRLNLVYYHQRRIEQSGKVKKVKMKLISLEKNDFRVSKAKSKVS